MATARLGPSLPKCQHSHMQPPRPYPPRVPGFTLIELMITVAIVAVLGALAYPSFMAAIYKSRRADAVEMMTKIQQAEERRRANSPAYTADLTLLLPGHTEPAYVMTPQGGRYKVSVTVPGGDAAATTYTIRAEASGSQVADTTCATMTIAIQPARPPEYGPTGSERCWAK